MENATTTTTQTPSQSSTTQNSATEQTNSSNSSQANTNGGTPYNGQSSRSNTQVKHATKESEPTKSTQKPQPPPQPEYREVKVNGQIRKYTIDELVAKAALADGAHEKFQSASQIQKQLEDRRAKYKNDPIAAFMEDAKDAGLSPDQTRAQFEKWYKQNFIDPEMMTAEQKRIAELERWKQQREAEDNDSLEKQRRLQEQQETQYAVQQMQKEVIDLMEQHQLPKTRFIANRIAYWMKQNLKNGFDAPPELILQKVKEERDEIFKWYADSVSVEDMEKIMPDYFKKIRKYDLERLNKKLNPQLDENKSETSSHSKKESKRKTMADVDNYFNNLRRSR